VNGLNPYVLLGFQSSALARTAPFALPAVADLQASRPAAQPPRPLTSQSALQGEPSSEDSAHFMLSTAIAANAAAAFIYLHLDLWLVKTTFGHQTSGEVHRGPAVLEAEGKSAAV